MSTGLTCEVCRKNEAKGVACVPAIPISVAYCQECLDANSHPLDLLIANTAMCGGFNETNEMWQEIVTDSLRNQGKTLEWFNEQVAKDMTEMERLEP